MAWGGGRLEEAQIRVRTQGGYVKGRKEAVTSRNAKILIPIPGLDTSPRVDLELYQKKTSGISLSRV